MARPIGWRTRIPLALDHLRTSSLPFVDRQCLQQLLGLGRRQAIRVLVSWGSLQSGKSFLLPRADAIDRLEQLLQQPDTLKALDRRKFLAQTLTEARRQAQARQIPIPPTALPAPLELSPGQLTIRFQSTEELLQALHRFALALAEDPSLLTPYVRDPPAPVQPFPT